MVTDIIFLAFADEMQKIASLVNHVRTAKGGEHLKALLSLANDPPAIREATARFHALKNSKSGLPDSLKDAPVPLTEPKGVIQKGRALKKALSWLNKNKKTKGFMGDARDALDAAMDLKL